MKKKILVAALLLGSQALTSTAARACGEGASSISMFHSSAPALLTVSQADTGMEDGSGAGFVAASPEGAQEEIKVKSKRRRANRPRRPYMRKARAKHKLSRKLKEPETSAFVSEGDGCCVSPSSSEM